MYESYPRTFARAVIYTASGEPGDTTVTLRKLDGTTAPHPPTEFHRLNEQRVLSNSTAAANVVSEKLKPLRRAPVLEVVRYALH